MLAAFDDVEELKVFAIEPNKGFNKLLGAIVVIVDVIPLIVVVCGLTSSS